ncbi:unnamed protein product, partial [Prorocentrum cordatum]
GTPTRASRPGSGCAARPRRAVAAAAASGPGSVDVERAAPVGQPRPREVEARASRREATWRIFPLLASAWHRSHVKPPSLFPSLLRRLPPCKCSNVLGGVPALAPPASRKAGRLARAGAARDSAGQERPRQGQADECTRWCF